MDSETIVADCMIICKATFFEEENYQRFFTGKAVIPDRNYYDKQEIIEHKNFIGLLKQLEENDILYSISYNQYENCAEIVVSNPDGRFLNIFYFSCEESIYNSYFDPDFKDVLNDLESKLLNASKVIDLFDQYINKGYITK